MDHTPINPHEDWIPRLNRQWLTGDFGPRLHARQRRELEARHDRRSAVLVPLFQRDGHWYLLLTRRTDRVTTHKGQICFPGGRHEPDDETLVHTALREATEEIGLDPAVVEVLGPLDDLITLRDMRITPYLGLIPADLVFVLAADEVEEVLEVRLTDLLGPDRPRSEWWGAEPPREVLFYDLPGVDLWGASARIVAEWLRLVAAAFDTTPGQA